MQCPPVAHIKGCTGTLLMQQTSPCTQIGLHWHPTTDYNVSHVQMSICVLNPRGRNNVLQKEFISVTLRGSNDVEALMMDGSVARLKEADLAMFLLRRVAGAQLEAIRNEASGLGWSVLQERAVALGGRLLLVLERQGQVITLEFKPVLEPVSVSIHVSSTSSVQMDRCWHGQSRTLLLAELHALLAHIHQHGV